MGVLVDGDVAPPVQTSKAGVYRAFGRVCCTSFNSDLACTHTQARVRVSSAVSSSSPIAALTVGQQGCACLQAHCTVKNPRAQDKQHLPSHACPRQGHVLPEAHTRFLLQVPLRLDMHARVELAHPSLLTHAHGQGSMSARAHERRPQGRLRVSCGVHGCEMRVTT